jgi:V/A-type H+/Na+-transporting ATPase subunit E
MGLEKIRQAVLSEAKAEATRIIDSAKKTTAGLLSLQKETAKQEYDRLCKLRMQAIEDEVNRKLIQFKGAAGKQVLDKRNELLKSLFQKAKMEIQAWPQEKYAEVMGRLIEKSAGRSTGKIRVSPEEKAVFGKVLSKLNEGRGDARITIDEGALLPERGGFIFVGADFEVDQTVDTLLKEIEHDLLPVIAADLFQGK